MTSTEQATHTPGAWHAHPINLRISGGGVEASASYGIAADPIFIAAVRSGYVGEKFDEANAHLIAAAPALLEAAEWAEKFLDDNDVTDVTEDCEEWRVWKALRAAIAAAKGERS